MYRIVATSQFAQDLRDATRPDAPTIAHADPTTPGTTGFRDLARAAVAFAGTVAVIAAGLALRGR